MKTFVLLFLTLGAMSCGYSKPAQTTQAGTVPEIKALAPSSQISGGSDFTLTVNGSNFNTDAVVNWNGVARGTTNASETQLTATIPAADIAAAGTAQVTVTNPGRTTSGGIYGNGTTIQAETSQAVTFTIN